MLLIPYSLDQTLQLLFISSRNFVWLLFKSSYYLRVVFIKLGTEDDEIHCLEESQSKEALSCLPLEWILTSRNQTPSQS